MASTRLKPVDVVVVGSGVAGSIVCKIFEGVNMSHKIRLVVPEAPGVQAAAAGKQRELQRENLRIGILDNSKGNADHLLRFVVEGLKAALPVKSVLGLRKPYASISATDAVLNQFTAEADFVIIAMAD